ncbi:MAG: response regulator, partial [Deltaproteobacteria bacterium]|nr:response regulator [Deltaproteobacteria bacterium]
AMAEGRPFDLVILDLTVPGGMGGKETMKKLMELDPKVRAIVSSGYSKDMILAEYKKFGFSGVIAKPYRVSDFSRVVKEALHGKKPD